MKDIRTWLIIALAGVILFMLLFKANSPQLGNIRVKYDSVIRPHITRIAELKRHEDILKHNIRVAKEKAKADSTSYTKTISKLKKELKAAKFTGNVSTVPDDTVQLAMDCLEREPIRDSIDSVNYARIAQLEQEKAQLVKDYESIMDDNQEQKNELQDIINLKDQEIEDLIKHANKAGRKGFIKGLLTGGVIGGVGWSLVH